MRPGDVEDRCAGQDVELPRLGRDRHPRADRFVHVGHVHADVVEAGDHAVPADRAFLGHLDRRSAGQRQGLPLDAELHRLVLVAEGLVTVEHGRGSFVKVRRPLQAPDNIEWEDL